MVVVGQRCAAAMPQSSFGPLARMKTLGPKSRTPSGDRSWEALIGA
jgi:hypothetical protein